MDPSNVELVRRAARSYQVVGLNFYDAARVPVDRVINLLAYTYDNTTLRDNPVNVEGFIDRIRAFELMDEIEFRSNYARLEWSIPVGPIFAATEWNLYNVGRPGHDERLQSALKGTSEALPLKKQQKLLNVIRLNPICITGQSLFATNHSHPLAEDGTFSNIMAPAWASVTVPTEAEMISLLDLAAQRFSVNTTTALTEMVDSSVMRSGLTVITHNLTHENAFLNLAKRETFGANNQKNPYYNAITVFRDNRPASGTENYLEIVTPVGERPVFMVNDQAPITDVIDHVSVSNGHVAVGTVEQVGFKAWFPHSILQVRPTAA